MAGNVFHSGSEGYDDGSQWRYLIRLEISRAIKSQRERNIHGSTGIQLIDVLGVYIDFHGKHQCTCVLLPPNTQ